MKNILIFTLLLSGLTLMGQIKTPSASPFSEATHTIGLTDVTIAYSRPGVKDRAVFSADGLVKHGQLWRLGANSATKMSFSDDVTVNGEALPKGDYAVLCTPSATEWTFHFFTYEKGSWSSYKEKTAVVTTSSKIMKLPMSVETFTIGTGNLADTSADIEFLWDKAKVTLTLGVKGEEVIMKNIEQVMAGPTGNDYYQAASYYHKNGKDLGQALTWIEKATSGAEPRFWQVRRKALILGDMGKVKEAISAATMSMELAQAAGNMEYVEMNKKSIKEWSK